MSTMMAPTTIAMTTQKLQEQVVPCSAPLNSEVASVAATKRPADMISEDGAEAKKAKVEYEHVSN